MTPIHILRTGTPRDTSGEDLIFGAAGDALYGDTTLHHPARPQHSEGAIQ